MRIAVVGTGYVGLVVGAGFAEFGNDVVLVNDDAEKIAALEAGDLGTPEPGLAVMMKQNRDADRVRFSTDLEQAVVEADVVFLTQQVEVDPESGPNLKPLLEVVDRIGKAINRDKVVVVKSTVPVGTAKRIKVRIAAHTSHDVGVASNPTFLKEGNAVLDFMKPDRVVIGTLDERAREVVRSLYAPFVRTSDRFFFTDSRSAELAKYATSALLASRVSYMNDLARLAERLDADIESVRLVIGADPRIGPKYLFVGPGFGGTHFRSDLAALLHSADEVGQDLAIVRTTHEVNERQKRVLFDKLTHHFGEDFSGVTVAVWGLSFKPRTDDVGGAPALTLVQHLLQAGATVRVHDPRAMDNVRARFGDRIHYADTMYDAVEGADALVLVTEWHQYRRPDFERIQKAMKGGVLVDGRNVWEPRELAELGLRYVGIGRG